MINLVISIGFQNRGFPDGTLRMAILVFILLLVPIFDRQGFPRTAKSIFIAGIYWAFFLYPIMTWFTSKPAEDIFLYIFTLLVMSSLVIVIHETKEWWLSLVWIVILQATFYYGFDYSIAQLEADSYQILQSVFQENSELGFGIIVSSLLLSLITWKFKIEQTRAVDRLLLATSQLEEKELEINRKNQELAKISWRLSKAQTETATMNDQLAARIEKRQQQLKMINYKLVNYGFIHSEVVQKSFEKSVAMLEGIQVFDDQTSRKLVDAMIDELDKLIFEIAQNLKVAEEELV